MRPRHDRKDYTIAWVCALSLELTAAIAILDERHEPLPQNEEDKNAYELGRVGSYNIVIATLPAGSYGVTWAMSVATGLSFSFPSAKICLMVGIAGGAPLLPQTDIRLGDIVVSEPVAGNGSGGIGGVLQYDFGKTVKEGRFVQTNVLNKPPEIFLTTLAKLRAEYPEKIFHRNNISELLNGGKVPKMFERPSVDTDRLFQAEYDHPVQDTSCAEGCDPEMVVGRSPRQRYPLEPYLHYGLIASANRVMKHGATRDKLSKPTGVLCFEMEAAGLMDKLPTMVIRGICDYSDNHKNKVWQPYAALAAAAFAKELLLRLPPRVNDRVSQRRHYDIKLPIAEGAAYGSREDQYEPECLDGTRTDLLRQISQWVEDPNGKCVFWMNGMAGTGKSTISRTVARSLRNNQQLGASFFFKRGEADRSSGVRFFTTLAVQLAGYSDIVAADIEAAIKDDPGRPISGRGFAEQFDKLIFRPLSKLNVNPYSEGQVVVILVDALDECEKREDVKMIIRLFALLKDVSGGVKVRVFLTGRPDLPILPAFKRLSNDTYDGLMLHTVPKIKEDISTFLRYELTEIAESCGYDLSRDWLDEDSFQKLVDIATPLFIYAATICRFIAGKGGHPAKRIKRVIEQWSDSHEPQGAKFETRNNTGATKWQASKLDKTYLPVLKQLVDGDEDDEDDDDEDERLTIVEEFKLVVGTIINLASPLSVPALARLLAIKEGIIDCRLAPLHSVLDIPKDRHAAVRMFHLSFRDFLLNEKLKGKSEFWVDEKEAHRRIASQCIQLMSGAGGVKENICGLEVPGTLRSEISRETIQESFSPELQYACRYWVYHLKQSGDYIDDESQAYGFLQRRLLHWLEAVSLLDDMANIFDKIDALTSIIDQTRGEGLSEFMYDVKRFVLQNHYPIDKAPLQVYYSAIISAPVKSIVRRAMGSRKLCQRVWKASRFYDEWDSLLQALEGHGDDVNCVAFSPNCNVLASGSDDCSIKLWNSSTGRLVQTLGGHGSWVMAIAFSPDGTVLASGPSGGAIKLWDAGTGRLLRTLEGHTHQTLSVVFSPDGKFMASGSEDNTVKLWEVCTGQLLQTLEGHTDRVRCLAFSPDGAVLASGSNDNTIKVWDATTHKLLRTLDGGGGWVASVAFSPDGKILASTSAGKTVGLWDASTWKLFRRLTGYSTSKCVAFSPNGKLLASGGYGTVGLWDVETWVLSQVLWGHTGSVFAVAFSYDGGTLASAFTDGTIGMWDVGRSLKRTLDPGRLAGRDISLCALAFSSDGNILVSVPSGGAVEFWDVGTKRLLKVLSADESGPFDAVAVALSPNGELLVVADEDGRMRLWSTNTGQLHAHDQGRERIWEASDETPLLFRREYVGGIETLRFSPDGKVLVSATWDELEEIKLWDTKQLITNENAAGLIRELREHKRWAYAVAFSPGGDILASGYNDSTVGLWEVANGHSYRESRVLRGHSDRVHIVEFLHDGKVLASASLDDTVRLWDVATGTPLRTLAPGDITLHLFQNSWHVNLGELYSLPFRSGAAFLAPLTEYYRRRAPLIHGEWLSWGERKLVWLPKKYSPRCFACSDHRMAFGTASGEVLVVDLGFLSDPSLS
ncbi:hypothetical protein TWF481_010286 [Arthrobotrys musiformis]|uniref:Nephrocystin 3-like N-terminal domain-containing protein n=1 Tax=Arthrobotrys musiformis TaxID=47236 RepID=A0AAV9W0J8_9PEZI